MKKENLLVTIYTLFMVLLAVGEWFLDFSWTNAVAQIIFYIGVGGFTYFVAKSIPKCDKRFRVLGFVILVSAWILNANWILFISGIVVVISSMKGMSYTPKISLIMCTAIVIASALLFDLGRTELVEKRYLHEIESPNNKYSVEQVREDAGIGGTAVVVCLKKDVLGLIEVSYIVECRNQSANVEWINEKSFTIEDEVIKVKF